MYYKYSNYINKSNQSLKHPKDAQFFLHQPNIQSKSIGVNNQSHLPQCHSALYYLSTRTVEESFITVESLTLLGVQQLWDAFTAAQSDIKTQSSSEQCPPPNYPIGLNLNFIP